MKSKKSYQIGDRVVVKSFAVPTTKVTLKKRYLVSESELRIGVDGWEAQITFKKEVDKLRKHGVPYKKGEKPIVFVADWQIIKKLPA